MNATLLKHEFRAMNSDIELQAAGPDAERRFRRAAHWLGAYEERFSRFRLLSELSLLNRSSGTPVRVSPQMLQLVELSLHLAHRSNGLFDPTILRDLEAMGYDRSFEQIIGRPLTKRSRRRMPSWHDIQTDHAARTVTLPEGAGLDLGGIGKGWAVDRIAAMLGTPSLVNGGGDIYASGQAPDEDCWRVGVADPFRPELDVAVLGVRDRGVATSSTVKRRWQAGDVVLHHLIDPRTGFPSTSDTVQVTVVASSATLADFHAKVALLNGAQAAIDYLNAEPETEGLVITREGSILHSSGLTEYLCEMSLPSGHH